METSTADDGSDRRESGIPYPLPAFVDWLAAAVVVLAGLATVLGGVVLTFLVDREAIADAAASGELQVNVPGRELTQAETVDFVVEVASWSGIGLLVTGITLVVFAVAYVVVRQRAHSRADGGRARGTFRSHAVLGAVAAAILSFLPFSPAIGGLAAGYFETYESARSTSVGALAGVLLVLPVVVELAFLTVGLLSATAAVGASDFAVLLAVAMVFAVVVTAVVSGGLGAVGGYVGGRLGER